MKRTVLSILAVLVLAAVPAAALAHGGGHHRHGKSGTLKAFDATTGDLTITTNKGRDITAAVTDDTRIQCDSSSGDDATVSSHGGGDDNGSDDHSGRGGDDHGDDDGANHDAGDDHGDDGPNHDANDDNDDNGGGNDGEHHDHGHHGGTCSTDDLVAGTEVRQARIDLGDDDAVWSKLKLVG